MNPETRLRQYQLNKYGKCFQCGADIIKDCKAVCSNCGYKDIWGIKPYQEDKNERKDTSRKYGKNTSYFKKTRKGDDKW